ncbi:hypothetical protein PWEIH_07666 [Listeria weihenstephanensis FSL R9-0317]|uniref:LXG domain-containing protein n=1 Tax=Listeria weihenstephanensis TaxID=1006155 RepID=A0A1S7FVS9_9LIST|nr:hypothetical protein [Listeria weihenstephanensis]AQY51531.1 hypothetical protein UE46_11125 [Listeria weihenstephanensis]EUJ39282.1 hypothetical protein PWEIH_07666 [Listeria weihenstephanensis FSL R9-0317]
MNFDQRIQSLKELLVELRNLENNIYNTNQQVFIMENAEHWRNTLAHGSADGMFYRIRVETSNMKDAFSNFIESVRNQIEKIVSEKEEQLAQFRYLTYVDAINDLQTRQRELNNADIDECVREQLSKELEYSDVMFGSGGGY